MDVPGPKLMDDEKHTQDLIGVCTPTFVTPNTRENAKLQIWSFRNMPVFYFLNPLDSHLLDFFMQALWTETQYNPLGHRYWSCVPYLLGEGQAMMYSFSPKSEVITDIPGVPFGRVPPNYLRDNMVATLARQDVEFDLLVQVQTDPHRMPIENAAVRWPETTLAVRPGGDHPHPAAERFDTPAHVALGKRLSLNPWHCMPSIVRWATRAARAGGCTRSCAGYGRAGTRHRTRSRPGTSWSTRPWQRSGRFESMELMHACGH